MLAHRDSFGDRYRRFPPRNVNDEYRFALYLTVS